MASLLVASFHVGLLVLAMVLSRKGRHQHYLIIKRRNIGVTTNV